MNKTEVIDIAEEILNEFAGRHCVDDLVNCIHEFHPEANVLEIIGMVNDIITVGSQVARDELMRGEV